MRNLVFYLNSIGKLVGYIGFWLCLSFFVFYSAKAQQTNSSCTLVQDSILHKAIYTTFQQMPEPIGGMRALTKAIFKQLKYPPGDAFYEGRIIVAFVIQANGRIAGERVFREPSGKRHLFSDQVFKIVRGFKWKPARCNNKPVASLYVLPVKISIQDQ